jgi:hypothetical protein
VSWLFVPDTADSVSASSSPIQECAQSVTWRGKHSAHRYWCDRWKRGGWIQRLSGLISPPSTLERGVAAWISSLRDSRVSHSPQRASDSPNETPATSGQTSPASSPKQRLLWSSSRTSPSEPSSSPSETFEQWASASRRQSDALRKTWALRIDATAGSPLLPTPSATSYGSTNNGCPKDGRTEYRTKGTPSLKTMARRNLWPTPTVGDSRASGNRTGSGNSKAHPGTSLTDAICRAPRAGGVLNPTWVEWLMGLPLGWTEQTDSALSEMAWSRWLRRMRGAL